LLYHLQMVLRLGKQGFSNRMSRHGNLQHMTRRYRTGINLPQSLGRSGGLHSVARYSVCMGVEILAHWIGESHFPVVQQRDVLEAPRLKEINYYLIQLG